MSKICVFEGGTFALYSLLCRNAKVGLLPSTQAEDQEVSTYRLELPSNKFGLPLKLKKALENSRFAKFTLLLVTMLATALVIGDGILTPCISGNTNYTSSVENLLLYVS